MAEWMVIALGINLRIQMQDIYKLPQKILETAKTFSRSNKLIQKSLPNTYTQKKKESEWKTFPRHVSIYFTYTHWVIVFFDQRDNWQNFKDT